VSTRVLRTIDKVGGLDEYLLGDKTQRIKELGIRGWQLRCKLMSKPVVQKRLNEQRRALGLPEVDYVALYREILQIPRGLQADAPQASEKDAEFEVEEVVAEESSELDATTTEDADGANAVRDAIPQATLVNHIDREAELESREDAAKR